MHHAFHSFNAFRRRVLRGNYMRFPLDQVDWSYAMHPIDCVWTKRSIVIKKDVCDQCFSWRLTSEEFTDPSLAARAYYLTREPQTDQSTDHFHNRYRTLHSPNPNNVQLAPQTKEGQRTFPKRRNVRQSLWSPHKWQDVTSFTDKSDDWRVPQESRNSWSQVSYKSRVCNSPSHHRFPLSHFFLRPLLWEFIPSRDRMSAKAYHQCKFGSTFLQRTLDDLSSCSRRW